LNLVTPFRKIVIQIFQALGDLMLLWQQRALGNKLSDNNNTDNF